MRMRIAAASLAAILGICSRGHAAIINAWDFNDGRTPGGVTNFGPSPLSPGTSDANVTSSGLVRGAGLNTNLGTSSGGANAWGSRDFESGNTSAADAVADLEYSTFSVSPNAGYVLSLTSIDPYNIRRSATGPSTGQWQYSLDGTNFTDIGSAITWGTITTGTGNPQASIDLSGISALQNLAEGTTVTFRVPTWGATSSGGTWYFNTNGTAGANDLVLNGTVEAVVVPEPMSIAYLTVVGLLLSLWRR